MKKLLVSILNFFKQWYENNQKEIKKYLWGVLIAVARATREHLEKDKNL